MDFIYTYYSYIFVYIRVYLYLSNMANTDNSEVFGLDDGPVDTVDNNGKSSSDEKKPEEKRFYWRVNGYIETPDNKFVKVSKLYSIPVKALKYVEVFAAAYDDKYNDKDNCSCENNPLIYEPMIITENLLKPYEFNLHEFHSHDVIHEYLNYWAENETPEKKECWLNKEAVKTGNFAEYFGENKKDLELIENYLNKELSLASKELDEINKDPNEEAKKYKNHYIRIRLLNKLSKLAYSNLGMSGLGCKIAAYMGCMIWHTSMLDLSKYSEDPFFEKLQTQSIEEFNKEHEDKIAKMVKSDTTGDGKEEAENKEQYDEDLEGEADESDDEDANLNDPEEMKAVPPMAVSTVDTSSSSSTTSSSSSSSSTSSKNNKRGLNKPADRYN